MRTVSLLLVPLLGAAAAPAAAQAGAPELPVPRANAGATFTATQPTGEFGERVDDGWGLNAHFRYALDGAGVLALRVEGGFVNYGREERPVLISEAIGPRITADLVTMNNILTLAAGPQLTWPSGPVRPYVNGTVGISHFETSSSLEPDGGGEAVLRTTHFDDTALSYGAAGGVYVPVSKGRIPVAVDLGIQWRQTAEVSYLTEGGIVDRPDGTLAFDPARGPTEALTYYAGVSVGLRRAEEVPER